ncbi:MAG: hypothetical protein ABI537_09455 [Casimicrobiaceae bacterium]
MTRSVDAAAGPFGPWNPGLRSQVPRELLHLATIFRPDNGFTRASDAEELRDLTGLDLNELATFRPQRLALHELLVRVTADFSVPDGSKIEDLGINFRQITRLLLARYIEPQMTQIVSTYDTLRHRLAAFIVHQLAGLYAAPETPNVSTRARRGFFASLMGGRVRGADKAPPADAPGPPQLVARWEHAARTAEDPVERAAYRALVKVVSALLVRHGEAWGGRELVATLAINIACNAIGSEEIGRLIEPWLQQAAHDEGYQRLRRQARPVVMNTKGASASGKSTLRPLQKALAGDIGVRWSEFALISPDIWRKQLLDYATLGDAYKYGGAFTGDEVQIIDAKLDRYMASKAQRGEMSHLLIDRFRFDSFAPDSNEAGSNLLTRFGHSVYLFFMITPPESLVERAWNRGLDVGRYKAVDDTLAHSVEAYSGMPRLFFTWIRRTDKKLFYEFLDNSVPSGERPRTVAFGSHAVMNILDVGRLLDVERFRRVNVDATASELLYRDRGLLAPENNTAFLEQCAKQIREINFAQQTTGRIYLRIVSGKPVWFDREALDQAAADADTRAGLYALAPTAFKDATAPLTSPEYLAMPGTQGSFHTLGNWAKTTL